ncbi:MAG: insulinase family protein, partial [Bacteroidetes bacterium]|nr:insulinase family protein [Bacteroidota bacterium]
RDYGMVTLNAGTTPERAQETLDVSVREIHRLREGVSEDEFNRTVTSLKSSLIMQGESTPARAAAVAQDHFRLGRARSLDDIASQIDAISHDQLNEYVSGREIDQFTLATLGPVALAIPEQVASG